MTVTLTGTDKQITWAESIRSKWIGEGHEAIEQNLLDAVLPMMRPESHAKATETVRGIKDIADAKWWIDNRVELSVNSQNYLDTCKGHARSLLTAAAKAQNIR